MRRQLLLAICLIRFASAQNIDAYLSVPFPSQLVASRDGNTVAWVFNNKGVRNIFLARAPVFGTRQVTAFNSEDGLEINDLTLSDDGRRVLFVKGNGRNGAGEAANPARIQTAAVQTLWSINSEGDSLRSIGPGVYPKCSPDNRQVAFINEGQIYLAPASGSPADTSRAKKLFQCRGSQHSIRWSPDGTKLAFISGRGNHAFLGVYDLADKRIQFPDPSVDLDSDPVWSPDGKSIAYIRTINTAGLLPFTPRREGQPWSIRLLNVTTGEVKEIWKAETGKGSVLNSNFPVVDNLLLWGDRDQLIFPWERDGWQHLYAVDVKKGGTRLLTPGDGEVENMILSNDRESLYYVTNINDINRRHICKVSISSGSIQTLTGGAGIEWSPAETSKGLVVLHSSYNYPGWPAILEQGGAARNLATELFPREFPAATLVAPEVLTITATDGMSISAQLFLPPDHGSGQASSSGKKYPAIVFFHGGSKRQMLPGFHYMEYYNNAYALNEYFATHGYIVLSVNYRSGIGYGLDFREALHYGAQGASEVNDVIGAGLYLKGRPDVDTKRIGLWGGSYGGYLTAFGLAKASDLYTCGVDIHGVHDWNTEIRNWVGDYDPAKNEAFARLAFQSSPVAWLDTWRSPVLMIHGDDDRNVPFFQSVDLAEKLRARDVHVEQLIFPDEIHDFLLHSSWVNGYKAAIDFFARQMKSARE